MSPSPKMALGSRSSNPKSLSEFTCVDCTSQTSSTLEMNLELPRVSPVLDYLSSFKLSMKSSQSSSGLWYLSISALAPVNLGLPIGLSSVGSVGRS